MFCIKGIPQCLCFLKEFQKEAGMLKNTYYKTVYQLFKEIDNGSSLSDLTPSFSEELIKDFSSIDNIFRYVEFPTCPNCNSCPLKHDCLTKANFKNYHKVTKRMKALKAINQEITCSFIHNCR